MDEHENQHDEYQSYQDNRQLHVGAPYPRRAALLV
jgi:hypothetical protein